MGFASKNRCAELFELSGWVAHHEWLWNEYQGKYLIDDGYATTEHRPYPAYDLGQLYRNMLPFTVRKLANGRHEAR